MKKTMRYKVVIFQILILTSALVLGFNFGKNPIVPAAQAATPEGQIVWRMDWTLDKEPETWALEHAIKEILFYTEGRLRIDLYPSSSLDLPKRKFVGNVADGLCEMSCIQTGRVGGEEPRLTVIECPGVWDSKADQIVALKAFGAYKEKVYGEWGIQYINSKPMVIQTGSIMSRKKDIRALDDLKGMKIRCSSARQVAILKALGAAPLTMSAGDVYQALKTGVIDAVMGGNRGLTNFRWGEVCEYTLETGINEPTAYDIVVNKKAWDSIPKDIQDVVMAIFDAWSAQGVLATKDILGDTWQRLGQKMGVKFHDLSAQDSEKFKKVQTEVWLEELNKKANPKMLEAWEIVKPYTNLK